MDKYLELTKNLISEFDKSSSDYLEINISDYSLTLKKGSSNLAPVFAPGQALAPVATPAFVQAPAVPAAGIAHNAPASQASISAPVEEPANAANLQEVTSPIVGVFYEAKDPTVAPFVKVGDSVKKGDVLCILESMKMMNEIRSDYNGIVKEIKCKNEELVEFGQVLFVLEKN